MIDAVSFQVQMFYRLYRYRFYETDILFEYIPEVERKNIHLCISFMAMMKCRYGYFKVVTTILASAS